MTGDKNGWRTAEEIEGILDFRRNRALKHFEKISRGVAERHCPICGYVGVFSPVRHKADVWCPSCDSRARHRQLKLWLDAQGEGFSLGAVLHFAAEPFLRDLMRSVSTEYVTADLEPNFDIVLNIEAMDLPDGRFDTIIAYHVLEHVDDAKAFAEAARVLRPGGRFIVTAPMIDGWDEGYEAPAEMTPEERTMIMTDPDHRRWYGRNIRGKFEAAGLVFSESAATEPEVFRHGLARGEKIFFGTKPA